VSQKAPQDKKKSSFEKRGCLAHLTPTHSHQKQNKKKTVQNLTKMRPFRPRGLSLWGADQRLSHQVIVNPAEISYKEATDLVAGHYAKQFDFYNANGEAVLDLVAVVNNLAENPVTGPAGATGATGPAGEQGQAGEPGEHGQQGDRGEPGPTGPTGLTGYDGATGVTGVTGPTGVTGATGVAGVTGATGATGVPGIPGVPGVPGEPGETGATGPQGPPGSGAQVCLFSQTRSVTITNSTQEINLINSLGCFGNPMFEAGSLVSGATYMLRAAGQIKSTSSANMQLQLIAEKTTILNTGNFAVTATSFSRGWNLEVQMVHDGTNLICIGQFLYMTSSNAMAGWCGQTTAAITAASDSIIKLLGNWTSSSSNNIITCTSFFINKLN